MRLLARLISSAICIATSVSCFAAAMERPIVSREHSVVLDGEQPLYVVTEINEMTDSRHENVVLIEDVVHSERYIARSLFDLTAEESVMEITDLSRRLYLRRSYVLLKTEARTFAEFRAEMDRHMELSELANVPVKLETPAFTHVVRKRNSRNETGPVAGSAICRAAWKERLNFEFRMKSFEFRKPRPTTSVPFLHSEFELHASTRDAVTSKSHQSCPATPRDKAAAPSHRSP